MILHKQVWCNERLCYKYKTTSIIQISPYHTFISYRVDKYVLWQIRQVKSTAWQIYSWITFHIVFVLGIYSTSTYKNTYKIISFKDLYLIN